jgi:hypothetical protein
LGVKVDMGAYKFQAAGMGEFIGWLQKNGQATDGSADNSDPDADGLNNSQEWIAGTNPTNAMSVLKMLSPDNATGVTVNWQSVSNVTYFLQSGTNVGSHPFFSTIQSNIVGQAGVTTFTDTNANATTGTLLYRVGVQQ